MSEVSKRDRAFISYSQTDKRYARRIHRSLEAYRVPKGGEAAGLHDKRRRIGRLFRDDEEMGAATDLGEALRGAIADSESLIVVCSRRAAQSKWVNDEVKHFKITGHHDKIFAVIVDGEPNVFLDGDPKRKAMECFPPALLYEIDEHGNLSDRPYRAPRHRPS
jgi:hypothetical protein